MDLTLNNKHLKELTKKQEKQIKQLYKETADNLDKKIKKLEGLEGPAIAKSQALKELKSLAKEEYDKLGQKIEKKIIGNMGDISQSVLQSNAEWLDKTILGPIQGSYIGLSDDVIRSIITGQIYDTPKGQPKWQLSEAIWGHNKKIQQDINFIIAQGVAENKSAFDIAKSLEQYVQPGAAKPWDWGKVYPGTSKEIDYNAQRLARTLVSHAYSQSLVRVTQNNPFCKGIKWLISNSHRVCEICIERAETDQYGLGAGVFPVSDLPLDHPNGMCTYEAVMDNLENVADQLADWVEGKPNEAIDNYVLDITSRYDLKPSEVKIEPPSPPVVSPSEQRRERDRREVRREFNKAINRNGPKNSFRNNNEKLDKALINNFDKAKLNPQERNAVTGYTSFNFTEMNRRLRAGETLGDLKKDIDYMTKAVNKGSFNETIYLRRGSEINALQGLTGQDVIKGKGQELVGKIIQDKGFVSTSPYIDGGFTQTTVEYIIEVPKGYPTLNVAPISAYRSEAEVILQRGTRFLINDVEEVRGDTKFKVYMSVLTED